MIIAVLEIPESERNPGPQRFVNLNKLPPQYKAAVLEAIQDSDKMTSIDADVVDAEESLIEAAEVKLPSMIEDSVWLYTE